MTKALKDEETRWESFGTVMLLSQCSQDLLAGMSAEESKKKVRDSLLAVSQRWDTLDGRLLCLTSCHSPFQASRHHGYIAAFEVLINTLMFLRLHKGHAQ